MKSVLLDSYIFNSHSCTFETEILDLQFQLLKKFILLFENKACDIN